ncbi:hypothetical protein GA0115261_111331, partial [Streptomyces sp. OspMP-M43]
GSGGDGGIGGSGEGAVHQADESRGSGSRSGNGNGSCGEGAGPGGTGATADGSSGAPLLVASCVDGTATRGAEPPVTAVDLRPAAYGRACAALLCDILAGRTAPDTVRDHAWSLEIRASTGPSAAPAGP